MNPENILEIRLKKLRESDCYRKLSHRQGWDFSSNDYLGFSQDLDLRALALSSLEGIPLGSSGSRLLRGHHPIFDEAEAELATFCGRESATLFATGYQANVGLLTALMTSNDVVFSDQYNHASIIDGIKLSGAEKKIFPHGSLKGLRKLLEQEMEAHFRSNRLRVIVTESLFGMDGDIAPLQGLVELAEEFSALLLVDEAHATGLWGCFQRNLGGGLVQSLGLSDRVFATVHPAGKAMGMSGAWVCGNPLLKDYLVNCSRPFIFSTAPLPVLAAFLKASIQHWKKVGKDRAQTVLDRSRELRARLEKILPQSAFVQLSKGEATDDPKFGPILPIILGENSRTLQMAETLQRRGLDVRAIRPPTVAPGSSRLRLTVNWNQSQESLNLLVEGLQSWK